MMKPGGIGTIPTGASAGANPGMDMATALMQPQSAQPAYGSDEWALQGSGPGGLMMRQLVQGLVANQGDPMAVLDPQNASSFFSPETAPLLRPEYQKAFQKKGR